MTVNNQLSNFSDYESEKSHDLFQMNERLAMQARTSSNLDLTSLSVESQGQQYFNQLFSAASRAPRGRFSKNGMVYQVHTHSGRNKKELTVERFSTVKKGISLSKGFKDRVKFTYKKGTLILEKYNQSKFYSDREKGLIYGKTIYPIYIKELPINSAEALSFLKLYAAPALT